MLRVSSRVRFCVSKDSLLLEQFARRGVGNETLSQNLSEYMEAKKNFDLLIAKYEIFTSKEKSTADAAHLVGLAVPKLYVPPTVDKKSS